MTRLEQETSKILIESKAIISDPDKWGKGYNAYNAEQKKVDPTNPNACQWCAFGILNKARHMNKYSMKSLNRARQKLAQVMFPHRTDLETLAYRDLYNAITSFNDWNSTKHDDIIDAFSKAIGD